MKGWLPGTQWKRNLYGKGLWQQRKKQNRYCPKCNTKYTDVKVCRRCGAPTKRLKPGK